MTVTGSRTYRAPIAEVVAMLRDPDATAAKYSSQGDQQVEIVECGDHDGGIRIVSTRVVTVDLPGFAKKVLKPTNTMRQTDDWRPAGAGSWTGSFDVDVSGAPVHIKGTMALRADGATTTHDVEIDVQVKVPLIGGRIADWAAKNDVRRTLDAEFDCNERWLAEHTERH
jgi:carbon monoxide dehydrogenase subunit G